MSGYTGLDKTSEGLFVPTEVFDKAVKEFMHNPILTKEFDRVIGRIKKIEREEDLFTATCDIPCFDNISEEETEEALKAFDLKVGFVPVIYHNVNNVVVFDEIELLEVSLCLKDSKND